MLVECSNTLVGRVVGRPEGLVESEAGLPTATSSKGSCRSEYESFPSGAKGLIPVTVKFYEVALTIKKRLFN